jgi:hypothetical protein
MAIQISDVDGRTIYKLGSTGFLGTSVNLATVAVTTVVIPGNWARWMPLFMFATRFSTGNGLVPTATVSAGTATPAVPVDFKAGGALAGSGPTQVWSALRTISWYGPTDRFYFAVTAGAAGTCDIECYGVIEAS